MKNQNRKVRRQQVAIRNARTRYSRGYMLGNSRFNNRPEKDAEAIKILTLKLGALANF